MLTERMARPQRFGERFERRSKSTFAASRKARQNFVYKPEGRQARPWAGFCCWIPQQFMAVQCIPDVSSFAALHAVSTNVDIMIARQRADKAIIKSAW
jgi:hypothetical protein